jgi:hypothetical protein
MRPTLPRWLAYLRAPVPCVLLTLLAVAAGSVAWASSRSIALALICSCVAVAALGALVAWVVIVARRASREAWSTFQTEFWNHVEASSREKRKRR